MLVSWHDETEQHGNLNGTARRVVNWLQFREKDRATLVDQFGKSEGTLTASPVNFSAMAPLRPSILGVEGNDGLVWLEGNSQILWSKLQ